MRRIKKALIVRVLQAELSHHLGYAEGEAKPEASTNQRNGTSGKTAPYVRILATSIES